MATFLIAETAEDASSHDNAEYIQPTGSPYAGLYLGHEVAGTNLDSAWIWRGTGIPQGSTILTCTITLRAGGDSVGIFDVEWYGFNVDSPTDFSNAHTTHRISDHHARTTAFVSEIALAPGDPYVTPSLVTVAQEIVNRAGFSGDLGFTGRIGAGSSGDGYYKWIDRETSSTNCALLTITWTVAGIAGDEPSLLVVPVWI
jgi:hypothetical protein